MRYRYRAKKGPEDIIEGVLDAVSESEAVEKISQQGYFPITVEADTFPSPAAQPQAQGGRRRVGSKEVTVFTRQLASLIKSGVPILQSLTIIAEQTENASFRGIIKDIYASIKEGAFFSSSLARHPQAFPPLFVALIHAGEGSGALAEALDRIADYRTKQEEFLSQLRASLAYPAVMAVVGVATIVFMLTFVIPRLTAILMSMGGELPVATKLLIATSGLLSELWLWVSILCAIFIVRRWIRSEAARMPLSVFKLRLPVFGTLILKSELARFCRTLELLIKNGIPILKALEIAIPVLDNDRIKQQLRSSYGDLEQGGSFGRSMKEGRIFPGFMTNLIIVGEESGRLSEALIEIAQSYERDTAQALKTLTSVMEPLLILCMGLIVGFIVVAMLLPIFEINVMAR